MPPVVRNFSIVFVEISDIIKLLGRGIRMKEKIRRFFKKRLVISLFSLIICSVLYVIIWLWFRTNGKIETSGINKEQWLEFFGSYLGFAGTVTLGAVSYFQNETLKKINEEQRDQQETESKNSYRASNYSLITDIKSIVFETSSSMNNFEEYYDKTNLAKNDCVLTLKDSFPNQNGLYRGFRSSISFNLKGKIFPSQIKVINFELDHEYENGKYKPLYFSTTDEFYPIAVDKFERVLLSSYLLTGDINIAKGDIQAIIFQSEHIQIQMSLIIKNALGVITKIDFVCNAKALTNNNAIRQTYEIEKQYTQIENIDIEKAGD